jgi:restriction system protein
LNFDNILPRDFEELVAELYAGLGYLVRLTQPSNDGGRDIIVEQRGPIPARFIIECKRPRSGKKIGLLPVRALMGTADDERPSKALLVTATDFSRGARRMELKHRWRVELKGARDLRLLARQYYAATEPKRV